MGSISDPFILVHSRLQVTLCVLTVLVAALAGIPPTGTGATMSSVREAAAQRVLLVRAIEEVDRDGRLLSLEERTRATAAIQATTQGPPALVIEQRAARLLENLAGRASWINTVLNATRLPSTVGWILPLLACLVGLLSDALGPERRVNILSVPLLGLILWNVGVYVALAGWWLERALRAPSDNAGRMSTSAGWVALASSWAAWRARRLLGARTEGARLAGQIVNTYIASWRRLAATLLAARGRGLLHLGAALLALGVLCGTYWRGIAFEYQATWESTFLNPHTLRALLVPLLGPASFLLGEPIPSATALAALRAPAAGEAATWIHRYALTTLLLVIGPRMLLAARAFVRAQRRAANLPVDLGEPYFMRLTPGVGQPVHVEILPYGIAFVHGARDTLRDLVRDIVGGAAEVRIEDAAPYGAEPEAVLPAGAGPGAGCGVEWWRMLVFSLAQSPEDEVHGALITRLVAWVSEVRPGSRRALVILDASAYRLRLAGSGAERQRVAERQHAWDLVGQRAGAAIVHLDLVEDVADDQVLIRLRRSVWPPLAAA